MALEGTIKEFGLADIFQLIALQKKTGTLFLNGSEGTVNIYFEDGMVVKTESSQRKAKCLLGRILINRRKITESQLRDAIDIQASTGQKLGSVLIGQGLISKDDLRDSLTYQMCENIYGVFRWKGGDYKFYQDKVDYDRDTVVPLNSENILMDGVRMLDEWPRIDKKLPPVEVVLKKTENVKKLEQKDEGVDIFAGSRGPRDDSAGLSKEASSILKLVDGKKSIYEILEYSIYGEFDTLKSIVDLMDKGFIARTGAKPEIMLETPASASLPKAERLTVNLDKLPFVFLAACLLIIFLQVTGTRKIMSAGETGLEALKDSFSVEKAETFYDNALLYYYDFGEYPKSGEDLVKHDYLIRGESTDPWGGPMSIYVDENDNLAVSSTGRGEKTPGSGDDTSGNP